MLKGAGASDAMINFFLVMFFSVIALIMLLCFVIVAILAVKNEQVPTWLIGIITSLVGAIVVLITVASQTQHINGTATKTAVNTVESLKPTIQGAADLGAINANTIQQIMTAIMTLQGTQQQSVIQAASVLAAGTAQTALTLAAQPSNASISSDVQANTLATEENTAATRASTGSLDDTDKFPVVKTDNTSQG
jgi:hypothetical protein